MLEMIVSMCIIAALTAFALPAIFDAFMNTRRVSDKQTLAVLNDALTRYKCEGGDINALTAGAPVKNVLAKLAATINWNGLVHSVIQKGVTYSAKSLTATGDHTSYQFTGYGAFQADVDPTTDITSRLIAQGTPPDDAMKTWIGSSLTTAGTRNFLVLSNPTDRIGMYVRGSGKLEVNWGDGTTNEITLSGSDQAIAKNYGSVATRPVVLIGNVSYIYNWGGTVPLGGAGSSSFSGDVSTMPSLTCLNVGGGTSALSGDISKLTGLTYINVGGSNTLSGDVSGLTGLTTLSVAGSNTLSGNVSRLTSLSTLTVGGSNTLSGSISGLTNLTSIQIQGSNTLSGSISGLSGLTNVQVYGSNTLTGSVTGLTSLTSLSVNGSNTLSGSVAGLTSLTNLNIQGSNTVSGSLAGLTNLTYLVVYGSNTVTGWENVAANATGLCYLNQSGNTILTSAQVNAVLAGFVANKDAAKPRTERYISIKAGNGAPTGQGLTDKAFLQGYKSPNGTGPAVWTVYTN